MTLDSTDWTHLFLLPESTWWPVKVCCLHRDNWVEVAMGTIRGELDSETEEYYIVVEDDAQPGKSLIRSRVAAPVSLRKQDTLLLWTGPALDAAAAAVTAAFNSGVTAWKDEDWVDENGLAQIAIGFQDVAGCAEISEFIIYAAQEQCEIVRFSVHSGSNDLAMEPFPEEIEETPRLPPLPNQLNLTIVLNVMSELSGSPLGRELLVTYLDRKDFLDKLWQVFNELETGDDSAGDAVAERATANLSPLERIQMLWAISDIVKQYFLVGDALLIEKAVNADRFVKVLKMLAYDRAFGTRRANFCEYYQNNTSFRQAVKIRDNAVVEKIRYTFKLQLLRDVLVRSADDFTFHVIRTLIYLNQADILDSLHVSPKFWDELFGLFDTAELDSNTATTSISSNNAGTESSRESLQNDHIERSPVRVDEKEVPVLEVASSVPSRSTTPSSQSSSHESSVSLDPSAADARDTAVELIYELTKTSRAFAISQMRALHEALIEHGLFNALEYGVAPGRSEHIMAKALETVSTVLEYDVQLATPFLPSLMTNLVRLLWTPTPAMSHKSANNVSGSGIHIQISDLLKKLLVELPGDSARAFLDENEKLMAEATMSDLSRGLVLELDILTNTFSRTPEIIGELMARSHTWETLAAKYRALKPPATSRHAYAELTMAIVRLMHEATEPMTMSGANSQAVAQAQAMVDSGLLRGVFTYMSESKSQHTAVYSSCLDLMFTILEGRHNSAAPQFRIIASRLFGWIVNDNSKVTQSLLERHPFLKGLTEETARVAASRYKLGLTDPHSPFVASSQLQQEGPQQLNQQGWVTPLKRGSSDSDTDSLISTSAASPPQDGLSFAEERQLDHQPRRLKLTTGTNPNGFHLIDEVDEEAYILPDARQIIRQGSAEPPGTVNGGKAGSTVGSGVLIKTSQPETLEDETEAETNGHSVAPMRTSQRDSKSVLPIGANSDYHKLEGPVLVESPNIDKISTPFSWWDSSMDPHNRSTATETSRSDKALVVGNSLASTQRDYN